MLLVLKNSDPSFLYFRSTHESKIKRLNCRKFFINGDKEKYPSKSI
ncbi:hypothetical protein BMWSH_3095 [Priestia megaterium WSH-002]|uniref:Uncharacterized protein n=1 Tax=Priestia megaterium (strain WSH-002) TaxID=1006007 RepID=A0A8D3WZY8_PRIMW|nr:hypothetical protein BMWSH_3095 [Priestia megaterium WSH-002]